MKALLRPAEVIVSTSIFTAFCALGLCIATERLFTSQSLPLFSNLHLAIFGATLTVYNLPRLLPRPYGQKRLTQPLRPLYFVLFFVGLALLLPAATNLNTNVMFTGTALAAFALAYYLPSLPLPQKKRLRDFGLVKIFVLTSVWTIATAVLPMLYLNEPIAHYPFEVLLRFVFVFALCILFDIRDIETDSTRNIRTLPLRIGVQNAYRLVYYSVLAFAILSTLQYFRVHDSGRLLAAFTTSAATLVVTDYTRRHPGHRAFVAMTDGMMLLYALLVVLQ
ncbi:MAG: UbiA family prenyltransferase [Chitinophagaceae bacterium]|nr:UbiA family prenyltransferase [Chitinophagaceae bacterium]